MQFVTSFLSFIIKSLRFVGFFKTNLPPQPLFDLFSIYKGVYCGGIFMSKDTDWEMHIEGDETLTLLSGCIHLVLKENNGERMVTLTPGRSTVVPAGIWHRQIVESSGELLFMTFGDTTEHRSIDR